MIDLILIWMILNTQKHSITYAPIRQGNLQVSPQVFCRYLIISQLRYLQAITFWCMQCDAVLWLSIYYTCCGDIFLCHFSHSTEGDGCFIMFSQCTVLLCLLRMHCDVLWHFLTFATNTTKRKMFYSLRISTDLCILVFTKYIVGFITLVLFTCTPEEDHSKPAESTCGLHWIQTFV